jgi:hypothetical protein
MRRTAALVALAALAASPALAQAPAPGDVVVNEILYDPPAGGAAGEWVEVVNRSDRTVDLAGVVVQDARGPSDPVPGPLVLAPGEYAVLGRSREAFEADFPGVPFTELGRFPSLNNTGDTVALVLGGATLDAVPYESGWGGTDASLERIDPDGPSAQASNFATTTDPAGGTPSAQNSVFARDTAPPAVDEAEATDAQTVVVTFSEPVSEATAETAANYRISDGVGAPASAERDGADAARVVLRLAAPLAGPQAYTLTVSGVADRAGNVLDGGAASFFFGEGAAPEPGDLVINEILYDPPSARDAGEYVELFNRTDETFDLRDFTLNDAVGEDQPVTTAPVFVEPGGYAVVVDDPAAFADVFPGVAFVEQPAWSALNNGGDAVVLTYRGEVIDSLFYQPSWGGQDAALEREDPAGPSTVAANWATTTAAVGTPGALNSQFAPDVTGPQLVGAEVSPDGRRVEVALDEPAAPASVTPAAFAVEGAAVETVGYVPGETAVLLALASPLDVGTATVAASGLTDLLGNTTAATSTTVAYEGDTAPPVIVRATAQSATVVRVTFSEGVTFGTGAAASTYALDNGVGTAASVEVVESADNLGGADGVRIADVTFPEPLQEQTLYTLTASGVADLAGNQTETTTARVFFGTADTPGPGDLVVTEVMYDPAVGSDGEYLEVLNTTADRVFDLSRVALDDGDGDGDPLAGELAPVLPGEYVAVVRDAGGFRAAFPEAPFVEGGSVVGLSNSGEAVVLRAAGAVLDSVFYDPDWHRVELDDATGISLERADPAGPSNSAQNWSSSLDPLGGTPSAENTVRISGSPVERGGGVTVTSPFAPTRGEVARITYTLRAEAALVRARIYDGGGRLVRELEDGRLSGSTATLEWLGTGDDGRAVRAGIYVVLVEAVDAQGGTTEAHKAAVVLARPDGP